MDIKLINIGFGNIVSAQRVITIIGPESAPIKRIIQDGRDKGVVIDATYGRRTRAVLIMDSGHIVLDISGEKREKMTVTDLLEQFKAGAGKDLDNDRILLS